MDRGVNGPHGVLAQRTVAKDKKLGQELVIIQERSMAAIIVALKNIPTQ